MIPAAALLCALAAAGEPCLVADELGRTFRTCFDPGNRLEAAVGVRAADAGPARPAALVLQAAWRWRGDALRQGGPADPVDQAGPPAAPEWLRDQAVLELDGALRQGRLEAARATAWRGTFVRRLAEPFVLLPGPRPVRLPFPFDVGMAVEAGGARWERGRQRQAEVTVVRSTLLLDLARHLPGLRRAAFGPSLAYDLWLSRDGAPVHVLVPFSGGALDLAAASADGRWSGALLARAGAALRVPGGLAGYLAVEASLERVVLAVNDWPVALGLTARAEHGATGRGPDRVEGGLVVRLAAPR